MAWCLVKHRENFTFPPLPHTQYLIVLHMFSFQSHCGQYQ